MALYFAYRAFYKPPMSLTNESWDLHVLFDLQMKELLFSSHLNTLRRSLRIVNHRISKQIATHFVIRKCVAHRGTHFYSFCASFRDCPAATKLQQHFRANFATAAAASFDDRKHECRTEGCNYAGNRKFP